MKNVKKGKGLDPWAEPPHLKIVESMTDDCLTIIPRARMGSESIAHEAAEGRMGY